MTEDRKMTAKLDAMLTAAQHERPPVPAGLRMRVLQDADRHQRRGSGQRDRGHGAPRWPPRLLAAIGGWPGAGGLVAATLCGFWIGANPPDLWFNLSPYDSPQSALSIDFGWSDLQENTDAL